MVKLNKIYTRTGDDGTTGLVDGSRLSKSSPRMAAIGDVDELNSLTGVAALHAAAPMLGQLRAIQNDLFDLGSDLATPGADAPGQKSLRITAPQIDWLETQIDTYNDRLKPLESFILPGGTAFAPALHLSRTVVRRAERLAVALVTEEPETSAETVRYLNRLSDLLFVLGRIANEDGKKDVLWVPGRFTGAQKG